MFSVGGEIVPEMLEVDALATVHQGKRRLAIKMEVPKVPHQPDVAPVPDARQEGVHQSNPIHLAGILRRISVRNHQSDVVADNPNALESKFARQRVDVLRHRGLGIALGRGGGLTGSP